MSTPWERGSSGARGEVSPRLEAFKEALADDFNTPRALAEVFELVGEANREDVPGAAEAVREMLELLGLESLAEAERGRRRGGRARCWPSGRRRGRRRTSSGPTRSATGSPSSAGRFATPRAAPASCRRAEMAANQTIYGKRPVAEAERGRRRVHRVWRAPETSAEELERLCGSPDHQGVVAEVDPYPYADRNALLRREGGADRRPRPGSGPAQPRRGLPLGRAGRRRRRRHPRTAGGGGHCRDLQGIGGRGRAPVDRPRPQPRRLARGGESGGLLDLGRRRRRRLSSLGCRPQRLHGPRPGRGGERDPPPCGLRLRRPRRPAAARKDRFPQRLRGRHGAALRGRPPARLSLRRPGAVATATAVARTSVPG